MKKFNINDYFYIQITDKGWEHLKNTVGADYIKHCIQSSRKVINDENWYRLQAHSVMELFPINTGMRPLFNTEIMIDNDELKPI